MRVRGIPQELFPVPEGSFIEPELSKMTRKYGLTAVCADAEAGNAAATVKNTPSAHQLELRIRPPSIPLEYYTKGGLPDWH